MAGIGIQKVSLSAVLNPPEETLKGFTKCLDCICRTCAVAESNKQSQLTKSRPRKTFIFKSKYTKNSGQCCATEGFGLTSVTVLRKSCAIQMDIRQKRFVWRAY